MAFFNRATNIIGHNRNRVLIFFGNVVKYCTWSGKLQVSPREQYLWLNQQFFIKLIYYWLIAEQMLVAQPLFLLWQLTECENNVEHEIIFLFQDFSYSYRLRLCTRTYSCDMAAIVFYISGFLVHFCKQNVSATRSIV